MKNILDILICPSCGSEMKRLDGSLKCTNNHSFDIARCGYVNLLPPGKGKNSHTGDIKEMVKARVDFLKTGYYEKISSTLAELIADYFREKKELVLTDMGAGEGYHTLNITENLIKNGYQITALGFDASKYASEMGMKKSKAENLAPRSGIGADFEGTSQLFFFPANIFSLPISDGSTDAAVSMFAPIPWNECRRILRNDGILAVVSSGKNHLIELREVIYENVDLTEFHPSDNDGFTLIREENLTYKIDLSTPEEIQNLFVMTPFYYKTSEEGKNRLYEKKSLSVTVDVNYTVFKLKQNENDTMVEK